MSAESSRAGEKQPTAAMQPDDYLAWCLDCGDTFRYDDTGGYNPPCRCGALCRSCCTPGNCEKEWPESDDDLGDNDDA